MCGYIMHYGHKLAVRCLCYSAGSYPRKCLTKVLCPDKLRNKTTVLHNSQLNLYRLGTNEINYPLTPGWLRSPMMEQAQVCVVFVHGVSFMQVFWMFIYHLQSQLVVFFCLLLLYLSINTNWAISISVSSSLHL